MLLLLTFELKTESYFWNLAILFH